MTVSTPVYEDNSRILQAVPKTNAMLLTVGATEFLSAVSQTITLTIFTLSLLAAFL